MNKLNEKWCGICGETFKEEYSVEFADWIVV
jgi:hypothetical protein